MCVSGVFLNQHQVLGSSKQCAGLDIFQIGRNSSQAFVLGLINYVCLGFDYRFNTSK